MVQVFRPSQPLALLNIKPGAATPPAAGVTYTVPIVLPTPDSRLTLSFALVVTQPNPTTMPFDITIAGTLQHTLWLADAIFDTGGSGLLIPVVNLVGTRAAPQVFPTDIAICGYGDDFQGGQDALMGEYSLLSPAGLAIVNGLRVALYVSYEATESEICDEEWSQIVSDLGIRAPQQLVFT